MVERCDSVCSILKFRIKVILISVNMIYTDEAGYDIKWQDTVPYLISFWTKWPPFLGRNFRCIFVNKKFWILIKISLKFVPNGPFDDIGLDNGLAPNRRHAIS